MKFNKLLSVFMIIALVFSTFMFAKADDTKTSVSLQNEVVGFKDETITVPVKISNNSGIMGYRLSFKYDSSKLEIVSVKNGLSVSSNFNDSIKGNTGSFDVVWNATENVKENGTLLSINFKVLSNEDELSEIEISYSQPDTFDEKFNDVSLDCHSGFVVLNSNAHSFSSSVVPPSCTEDGYTVYKCNECDKFYKTDIVKASGHKFADNAKTCSECGAINPDYKESDSEKDNNSGSSSGTGTNSSETVPAKKATVKNTKTTKITKLTKKSKAVLVKWKKTNGINGYQIQYSTKKSFTKKTSKKVNIKSAKKTKYTIKKLKRNKKYFVRIRTYKTVNGKKYYSKWSKAKSVKTK